MHSLNAMYLLLIIIYLFYRFPVKYIQIIYRDSEQGTIVIDVIRGNKETVRIALTELPKWKTYEGVIRVFESDPGEYLMENLLLSDTKPDLPGRNNPRYNRLIGSGSLVGCYDAATADEVLGDRNLKTIEDISRKYQASATGTLSCIVKHEDKFYAMTAQHVLDKVCFSSNTKKILSQVHFECEQLVLADHHMQVKCA